MIYNTQSTPEIEELNPRNGEVVAEIGQYRYQGSGGNALCSSKAGAGDMQQQARLQLIESFKSLKAIQ